MKNLEVVIPAYNEQARIKNVIEVLQKSSVIKRIIVVDDASKDHTFKEVQKAGADLVLKHSENKGKGSALQTGIKEIKGDIFLIVDADLKNFKQDHINLLVFEYEKQPDLVLINGLVDREEINSLTKDLEKLITGIRLIKKKVWQLVKEEKINKGYEIDYLIYEKAKKVGKIKTVVLFDLKSYKKTEKNGFLKGFFLNLNMFFKIIYNTLKRKI